LTVGSSEAGQAPALITVCTAYTLQQQVAIPETVWWKLESKGIWKK